MDTNYQVKAAVQSGQFDNLFSGVMPFNSQLWFRYFENNKNERAVLDWIETPSLTTG